MSESYKAVQWVPIKKAYDLVIAAGVLTYMICFFAISKLIAPTMSDEIIIIRALGTGAFVLLHVILVIGPLARLNPRLLPLLYNRRHLGVTMFFLATGHAALVVLYYHLGGDLNPLVSIFSSAPLLGEVAWIPFQPFGFFALIILFLMAATSHDFWLANLTAPVWKALHMLVYVAYLLLVAHVVFGVLQTEQSLAYVIATGLGIVLVGGLHMAAGSRSRSLDKPVEQREAPDSEGYYRACSVADIAENRAEIVNLGGERVAVFKYDGKISAVSNVCQHQNGPLGEGKIFDGCITCPWHSFQYYPDSGKSPEPFTEKIPTFRSKVIEGEVWVNPMPCLPGTRVEPATISS